MKDYIKQFYTEGFATTFYVKPMNFVKKYINNEAVVYLIRLLIKLIYTLCAIAFMIFMFIQKWPF